MLASLAAFPFPTLLVSPTAFWRPVTAFATRSGIGRLTFGGKQRRHALDQFDEAVEQGLEGGRAHVGASAELRSVADEIVQMVRVMDGLNRYRFINDTEALAAWESASNVVGPPRPAPAAKPAPGDTPPAAGEARTAA